MYIYRDICLFWGKSEISHQSMTIFIMFLRMVWTTMATTSILTPQHSVSWAEDTQGSTLKFHLAIKNKKIFR